MTAAVDITPSDRNLVLDLLQRYLPGVTVWAYGSRVKWTARSQSDLDLVAFVSGNRKAAVSHLREALEESSLPFPVDLLVWDELPESFRENIESDYAILQEPRKSYVSGEWRESTLGEVLTLQRGFDLPETERIPGLYSVIASTGQVGTHNTAVVKGPGVVIGRSGSLGGGQFVKQDFWPLNTTLWVKDFHGNDIRFCYYLLRSLNLADFNAGSGVPTLNRNHIHPLSVKIPRVPDQQAISHILGTLDDKIELNRRMNQTLEEMARAFSQDWFVDFGPVRAKLEDREPYLPPELWSLFPNRLVDSELGEVPEGWEVKPLEQFVELNPSEPMKKGTIGPYIDMAALPTSGSSPEDAILREFTSGTRFRNEDTLLARITPCLENGKTAFVQSLPEDAVGWGSTEFIVMRAIPPVPPEYSYLLARDGAFREHAIQSMTGTSGRQRVQVDALAPYLLASPPPELWAKFSSLISPVFDGIRLGNKESCSLTAQRDTLLLKLVRGEVPVGELQTT